MNAPRVIVGAMALVLAGTMVACDNSSADEASTTSAPTSTTTTRTIAQRSSSCLVPQRQPHTALVLHAAWVLELIDLSEVGRLGGSASDESDRAALFTESLNILLRDWDLTATDELRLTDAWKQNLTDEATWSKACAAAFAAR